MTSGLVLVKLSTGKEKQTLKAIKETKGVAHVSAVYGRWDAVVDVEAEDLPMLTKVVIEKIRAIPGVLSTETLITTAI
jgi:DNA-binding Lrp family transcriptional regulator